MTSPTSLQRRDDALPDLPADMPGMAHANAPAALRTTFASLRGQGLRARDIALRLGISEGALVAAHATSRMSPQEANDSPLDATPLDGQWVAILQALEAVGPVMALTRNDHVVHEKVGVYRNVSAKGPMGLAIGPEIDLRLFLQHWHAGFHVRERTDKGEAHSLQFFDRQGRALHKVHLRPQGDVSALEDLAQRHADPSRQWYFQPEASAPQETRADADIDCLGLGDAWSQMRDTHEFFDLLKRFKVGRRQAMRLMEGIHTRRTPVLAIDTLLRQAAENGLPIMVFVGNAGCIQIHTGPIHRVSALGPWLNVMDEGFNLHLRTDAIHESWLVSKPTDDGVVTSIELFNDEGEVIAMIFGERKPGKAELPAWRSLAHALVQAPPHAAGAGQPSRCAA